MCHATYVVRFLARHSTLHGVKLHADSLANVCASSLQVPWFDFLSFASWFDFLSVTGVPLGLLLRFSGVTGVPLGVLV